MKLSIIIPMYNSTNHIDLLLKTVEDATCQNEMFSDIEVILVNDGSTDDTVLAIQGWQSNKSWIILLNTKGNIGQQAATYEGMKQASGDVIATIDDDLKHSPYDIVKLAKGLNEGAQLIFGVNESCDVSKGRKWCSDKISHIIGSFYPILKGKRVSSFRCFTKELNKKAIRSKQPFIYVSCELLNHAGQVGNRTVSVYKKGTHASRYTLKKLVETTMKLIIYYHPIRRGMLK
ncbi:MULTISPECIES: glycosyltransferase [unclassified Fusibacter]|uniref:glycosyltransferase family 2 protein n=1 Tax=unclassified Fusibacter TaxID=2624464 RepID=UPI001012CAE0|nr:MULTISPECIES: glycosyltransferase [unclassified Fusibacter]MCK8058183.1 glycosyltransferase [Fusibacter sp. A2]NPE20766.1 glycosyltransferase [Fusibacter sp. A1]RXV62973.1 glycosyltransferase [Fusibacter sp. A1]